MRTALALLLCSWVVVGCGDSSSSTGDAAAVADLSASVDLAGLPSCCGHPGDTGNSLGVGQFCNNGGPDCTGSKAALCSAFTNGTPDNPFNTYFCSFLCMADDPPGSCGENASCLCSTSGACACIPDSCVESCQADMGSAATDL